MADTASAGALLAEARAQLEDYKDRLMTRRGSAGMHHEQRLLALTGLIRRIDEHMSGQDGATGAAHSRGGGTSGGSTGGISGTPGSSGGASGVSGGRSGGVVGGSGG